MGKRKRNMDISKLLEDQEKSGPPSPDIAICSECNGRFKFEECITATDGDWETGYYTVLLCPVCPEGGEIDNYDYSPEQLKKYNEYKKDEE